MEINGDYSGDDDTVMVNADDSTCHDKMSVMMGMTEMISISERGESTASIGSLSTYLAKTSIRPRRSMDP